LETLDQLLGGEMPLRVMRRVFRNDDNFLEGIAALVRAGDIVLRSEGEEVPRWRLRELFDQRGILSELEGFTLDLTKQGAGRIA
jgi:hypothetical protein